MKWAKKQVDARFEHNSDWVLLIVQLLRWLFGSTVICILVISHFRQCSTIPSQRRTIQDHCDCDCAWNVVIVIAAASLGKCQYLVRLHTPTSSFNSPFLYLNHISPTSSSYQSSKRLQLQHPTLEIFSASTNTIRTLSLALNI